MRLYLEILQRKGEKGVNDELVWLCVRGVCVCGGGGGEGLLLTYRKPRVACRFYWGLQVL